MAKDKPELIDSPKELLELIDSCLKPKQKEKQENGEVFTPIKIVDEMLDRLDQHHTEQYQKSIFTEINFKWLDQSVGMGNFMVAVYLRLIKKLDQQIPDLEARKKHILENMLYMSELNKKNAFICNQIFNINGKYKLNLHQGDTLLLNVKKTWKLEHNYRVFDVILGNPPYNKGGIKSHTGLHLNKTVKNETIWPSFVEQALGWLKSNTGYLAFIHPLSWLKKSHKPTHTTHDIILEKYIIWLQLWDAAKSKRTIGGKIPISLYILQNTRNTIKQKTDILSILTESHLKLSAFEYLNPNMSIPLAYHSIFNKLSTFIGTNKLNLEYQTKTIKTTETKKKIPKTYTLADKYCIDTFTLKKGIMVKKATIVHPDADIKKLIIANKSSFSGAFIDNGKLGLTGNHKFYIIGDKLELMLKLLNFKIIMKINNFTKYGQNFLDNIVFTYIPDIRKLNITDITEVEFHTMLGLTPEEITLINN